MDTPILETRNISVRGTHFADITIAPDSGLTLLTTARESSSSSYAMVLSGRMRPRTGQIHLNGETAKPKELAKNIALAGVMEIDSLERLVTVRSVVREQIAWASPWYKRVPRDISEHPRWEGAAKHLELDVEPGALIGDLTVSERFRLRIALALVARPEAKILIVDDPDQVRSMTLRAEILGALNNVARELPVIVVSTNPDFDGLAEHTFSTVEVAA